VQFPAGIATVSGRVWTCEGQPHLAELLNLITPELRQGPGEGFDIDWSIANQMAARENGTVLDPPPPAPVGVPAGLIF
jgi:hypothetical protein